MQHGGFGSKSSDDVALGLSLGVRVHEATSRSKLHLVLQYILTVTEHGYAKTFKLETFFLEAIGVVFLNNV
jgi:hypothetical protein